MTSQSYRWLPAPSAQIVGKDGRVSTELFGYLDELARRVGGQAGVTDGRLVFSNQGVFSGAIIGSGLSFDRATNTLSSVGGGGSGGIPEAPQDGAIYGRQNGAWAVATGAPGAPLKSVQFNNGGAFGGSSSLLFDSPSSLLTLAGNQSFSGASRSLFVFSDSAGISTPATRLTVRSNVANTSTIINFAPTGTGTYSAIALYDREDINNGRLLSLAQGPDYASISSALAGTATQQPFCFATQATGASARFAGAFFPTGNWLIQDSPFPTPPSDPGFRLQVDGTLNLATTATRIYLQGSAGSAGQVLTSQGAGSAPTWSAAGGVSDGDKGDITVSGSGATWTIDNDVVTYAKMQNVSAASRLLGRGSSGSGDPEEITLGTNLSMSGTTLNATGGSGSPGGANTEIQFNDSGAFGGDADLTWDKTGDVLTIDGGLTFTGNSRRIGIVNANDGTGTAFRGTTTNGTTVVHAMPNGSGGASSYRVWRTDNPTTDVFGQFSIDGTSVNFDSSSSVALASGIPLAFRSTNAGTTNYNATVWSNGNWRFYNSTSIASDPGIAFHVNGFARYDSAVGIGTAPATSYNGVIGLEVGLAAAVIGNTAAAATYLTSNARYLTSTNWTYKTTNAAILWTLSGRDIYLQHAASGSAGTAITLGFGLAFFGATGNLNIGTAGAETSGAERLQVDGSLSINSATMIRTYTAFTNGAGAGAGTLTNAPSAGNPTKWIPINDNGTTRYIPAW